MPGTTKIVAGCFLYLAKISPIIPTTKAPAKDANILDANEVLNIRYTNHPKAPAIPDNKMAFLGILNSTANLQWI